MDYHETEISIWGYTGSRYVQDCAIYLIRQPLKPEFTSSLRKLRENIMMELLISCIISHLWN